MAWDSSRPVPWKRLLIEWAVATLVIVAVFSLIVKERRAENYIAVGIGGLMYVAVGAVMAKFGYSRKTFAQARAEGHARETRQQAERGTAGAGPARARPAATSRTNAGNRQSKRRR